MTAKEITALLVKHYQDCQEWGATREAAILKEILLEITGKKK